MGNQSKIEIILSAVDMNVKKTLGSVNTAMTAASASAGRFSKATTLLQAPLLALTGTMARFGAGLGALFAVGSFVKIGDEYTNLNARLKLVTKSSAELKQVQDDLYALSQETGTGYAANATTYQKLAIGLSAAGASSKELIGINTAVSKSLIVNGSSAEMVSSFLLQFGQAMGSGVLQGEEFRAMMESNSYFGQMLAKSLDTDIAGLRAMSKQGELTTDVIRKAVPGMLKEINESFAKMPLTIGRATEMMKNAFGKIINGSNEASGATGKIAQAIKDFVTTLEDNGQAIEEWIVSFVEASKAIMQAAWEWKGFIAALAGGTLAVGIFAAITQAVWGLNAALVAVTKVGLATMLVNPITLAVLALAGFMAAAVSAFQWLTSESAATLAAIEQNQKAADASRKKSMAAMDAQHERSLNSVREMMGTADKIATKAPAMDEDSWKSFQEGLKNEFEQMAVTAGKGELALAEASLSYSRQGMDAAKAENLLRVQKMGLLDSEIIKLKELRAVIPADTFEGKGEEARTDIDAKINGLRVQRIGLLKEESESGRKLAEEARKDAAEELKRLEELASARRRYSSQQVIVGLEEERLAASRLPTELARIQAEAAIDERAAAEHIRLKEDEIAALKALEGDHLGDIIQFENDLLTLRIDNSRQRVENERAAAAEILRVSEDAWRRGTLSVQEYQLAVKEAVDAGAIYKEDADRRMILSGDNMTDAMALGFSDWAATVQTDAEFAANATGQVIEAIASGFGSAFTAMVDGTKSAKEAMVDLARSTLQMVTQMIAQQLIYNAVKAAGSAMGFATGGQVQQLAAGGMVGGWSPHKKADNVPIWATAREFMQPVDAVDYYGLSFMESIRRRAFPRNLAHALAGNTLPRVPSSYRLADGGQVPGAPQQTTLKSGDTRLRVINVLDKNMVGDFLSTADGETAIINMIRRNGTTIRTLIGG